MTAGGLGSILGEEVHLELSGTSKQAALSDANAPRPWQDCKDVPYPCLDRSLSKLESLSEGPPRFKPPPLPTDATVIKPNGGPHPESLQEPAHITCFAQAAIQLQHYFGNQWATVCSCP